MRCRRREVLVLRGNRRCGHVARHVEQVALIAVHRKRTIEPLCSAAHFMCVGKPTPTYPPETAMTLGTILLIILILMLVGALPSWPHSRAWGYGPSGLLGVVLVVLLILLLM